MSTSIDKKNFLKVRTIFLFVVLWPLFVLLCLLIEVNLYTSITPCVFRFLMISSSGIDFNGSYITLFIVFSLLCNVNSMLTSFFILLVFINFFATLWFFVSIRNLPSLMVLMTDNPSICSVSFFYNERQQFRMIFLARRCDYDIFRIICI